MSTPRLSPTRDQLERLLTEPLTAIVRDHLTLLTTKPEHEDAIALGHALYTRLLRLTLDLGAALGVGVVRRRRHTDAGQDLTFYRPGR